MEPREKPTFQESVFTARGLEKRVMMVGVLAGAGFVLQHSPYPAPGAGHPDRKLDRSDHALT
ncbi:MAG: hypothetical protein AAF613_10615 [Pseudomonadota bacterium]